jgi:hypothetical protein
MSKYFIIDGYWKDDLLEFRDFIVREYDDIVDEEQDNEIFYYGLSEAEILESINNPDESGLEFVITNYKEIKL